MIKSIFRLSGLMAVLLLPAAAGPAQSRTSISAAEVNGTYKMNFGGKFSKMSNEIKILALGHGKLRFAMDLIFPYTLRNGEISVNMGGLDGELNIVGDTATYNSEDPGKCRITFKFVRPGTLKITQDGTDAGCGFGHNVSSAGSYRKVSGKRPSFEDQ